MQRLIEMQRKVGRRRGMTLVEIMVAITIIASLTAILGLTVFQNFADSNVETTRLTMNKISERIEIYRLRKKKLPNNGDGLSIVFNDGNVPSDAWGNEILYVTPGQNGKPYDLISLGADGKEGGSGSAADVRWSDDD